MLMTPAAWFPRHNKSAPSIWIDGSNGKFCVIQSQYHLKFCVKNWLQFTDHRRNSLVEKVLHNRFCENSFNWAHESERWKSSEFMLSNEKGRVAFLRNFSCTASLLNLAIFLLPTKVWNWKSAEFRPRQSC